MSLGERSLRGSMGGLNFAFQAFMLALCLAQLVGVSAYELLHILVLGTHSTMQ